MMRAGAIFVGDTVLDAPLYIHLPKLILWALFEGNLAVIIAESYRERSSAFPGYSPGVQIPAVATMPRLACRSWSASVCCLTMTH